MRELESKYQRELVVIGVHSGKYHAERITDRIRDASIRLDAIHPVANDRQFRTWRAYAVSAWPTIVAIDPAGYVVGAHAGEFVAEMLFPFIDGVIDTARSRGILNDSPVHFAADGPTKTPGQLRYPGKVLIAGDRIAVADSGNNRVVIARLDAPSNGTIERVVEGFNYPQGMAVDNDALYIADAGNHSIRAMDLRTGALRTVVGTGSQMRTRSDRTKGAMSSPWDVAISGRTLFIAMAGTHQIWSVDLESGSSRVHAGTGGEDIRDGDNQNALLAQPMGITLHNDKLFVADSESNGIRSSERAETGSVETIVGTGLFDFGNVDGNGDDVRLQHPQGITPYPKGGLLVADSYNDSIKHVDPAARSSMTWLGGFNEPSGISCSDTHAYVADTNAHRIMVVDLETREITELTLS